MSPRRAGPVCARSYLHAASSPRAGRRLRKGGASRDVESDGSPEDVYSDNCHLSITDRLAAPLTPLPPRHRMPDRHRGRHGTFEFESASGVYSELQCGSYIFMDADYGRNLDRDGAPTKAFEPSLFVWATVMSRPTDDRAIVDAGLKALAFELRPAARLRRARRHLRARLRRARPPRHLRRHQPPRARRQDPPRPRPLRPHRQPLRLVRRHPRQPRRAALADHRKGRCVLIGARLC